MVPRILILSFLFGFPCLAVGADALRIHPYTETSFELTHPSGTVVKALIRVPKLPVTKRLPVVLVFGGFQEAATVLEAVKSKRPIIVGTFDYPFSGSRKLTFKQVIRDAARLRRMVREVTPLIGMMADKIREREDVDRDRIVLLGASFGAPFAIYAAARDVAPYLVLVHGFADVIGTVEFRLHRLFTKNGLPGEWLRRSLAWSLSRLIWLAIGLPKVEDEAERLRAHQSVLTIEANLDRMIAASSRKKLREALQTSSAKVEVLEMESGHLQGIDDRLLQEILPRIEDWMVRNGVFNTAAKKD